MENKDLKDFGALMLALFVIMIIAALTYIGADYLKETACEQNQGDANVWSASVCYNTTPGGAGNPTSVTVKAVTKVGVIETILDVVLGLLTLVVIVAIFKVVVKTAKGF